MLESLNPDLDCHRHAPDKDPARRLATLEAAGDLAIPFTTGILVGIGESRQDRLDALRAIAASHPRHGHVQEVIVQNFLPKPLTPMRRNAAACPSDEYRWTLAAARLVLPADVHLQAPPNLTDDFGSLLAAGIDDWGGVSPVTPDHVNPERPWPDLDRLREVTEAARLQRSPRASPSTPSGPLDPDRWLDPRDAVPGPRSIRRRRTRPRRPRRHRPERVSGTRDSRRRRRGRAGRRPLHRLVLGRAGRAAGPRPRHPHASPAPSPRSSTAHATGRSPASTSSSRCSAPAARRSPPSPPLADELRSATVGDTVTWVHNRNINYTNVCTFKCRFCGFSKGPLVTEPARHPVPLDARRHRRAHRRGMGPRRHRGDVAGRHPPELRRRLLRRRRPRCEGRRTGHPRPRLHRARGHRRRQAARRAARRLPAPAARRRARQPARDRR